MQQKAPISVCFPRYCVTERNVTEDMERMVTVKFKHLAWCSSFLQCDTTIYLRATFPSTVSASQGSSFCGTLSLLAFLQALRTVMWQDGHIHDHTQFRALALHNFFEWISCKANALHLPPMQFSCCCPTLGLLELRNDVRIGFWEHSPVVGHQSEEWPSYVCQLFL